MDLKLNKLKHWFGWIGSLVAFIVSSFAGFDLLSKVFLDEHNRSVIAVYYSTCCITIGTIYLLYRQYNLIRKEKYANISFALHNAMNEIRNLQTYIERNERKVGGDEDHDMKLSNDCKIIASRVLTHVAQIFCMLTSTNCRASIKLHYEENQNLYLYTFARDASSNQRTINMDEKRVKTNHDPLKENKQMADLFDEDNDRCIYLII